MINHGKVVKTAFFIQKGINLMLPRLKVLRFTLLGKNKCVVSLM